MRNRYRNNKNDIYFKTYAEAQHITMARFPLPYSYILHLILDQHRIQKRETCLHCSRGTVTNHIIIIMQLNLFLKLLLFKLFTQFKCLIYLLLLKNFQFVFTVNFMVEDWPTIFHSIGEMLFPTVNL